MMLLLGATGLLGGQVLRRMRENRYPIRLFIRGSRDWKTSSVQDLRQRGVEVIISDVLDYDRLDHAAEGCSAIVNLIGVMRPEVGTNVEAVHVEAVSKLVEIAQARKIQRLVHVSCLGATQLSESAYLQSKWQSEQIVSAGRFYWTVLRPSFLFGDKFPFMESLLPLIRFRPVMPVLGSGLNRLQPVHVDDVAQCIVRSIYDKGTVSKSFDLAGPELFTLQEFMEKARKQLKLGGASMNVPGDKASKVAAALGKIMPRAGMNTDLLELFLCNSYTQDNGLTEYFKVSPTSLSEHLPAIMAAY